MELSSIPSLQPATFSSLIGVSSEPLIARVYLKLGTWQWALSPSLDDGSIQGGKDL